MKNIKTIKLLCFVALMMISALSNAQTNLLTTNGGLGWSAFSLPTPGPAPNCTFGPFYNFNAYGGQPAGWQTGFAPNTTVTFPLSNVMWVNETAGQVHGALFQNNFPVTNWQNPHWLVFRANNDVQIYINGNLIPGGPFNWSNGMQTICIPPDYLFDGNNLLTMQVTEWCDNGTQIQLDLWTNNQATITPGNQTLCITDTPITLSGSPAGGTWGGNGISGVGVFTPSASNVGINNITYTVIAGACTSIANVTIEVDSFCCPDECYWTVQGNNIQNGNNIFGTKTNDDIEIFTNNTARGIITKEGDMALGIMAPQARLHVFNNTWGKRNIDVTGNHPNIMFYQGATSGPGGQLGYATGGGHFSKGAVSGDFIMRNTNEEGSLLFSTGQVPGNTAQRIKIDYKGQVGINTYNSAGGNPTAFLHVNCAGNNEKWGVSDVRFENLEFGEGVPLVINDQGYVFRSEPAGHDEKESIADTKAVDDLRDELQTEKEKNDALRAELDGLKSKVDILFEKVANCCASSSTNSTNTTPSFKVYPNPASDEISTEQYIPMNSENAQLVITDMTGRTIKTVKIHCTGLCNLKVDLPETISGSMIICTLNIDDKVVDTKKVMLLRK